MSTLSPIEDIIADAKAGRMFILVDDEDRENEGDLIIPAQCATTEDVPVEDAAVLLSCDCNNIERACNQAHRNE